MKLKSSKSVNRGLVFVCLAVSSIAGTVTVSSKVQQTPLLSLLQPESAIAQTPTRESEDAIVRWNALTLDTIKAEKTSPPMAARNLAMFTLPPTTRQTLFLKLTKYTKWQCNHPPAHQPKQQQ